MLAPYLDEIELLLFESSPDSLPSQHQIKTLSALANKFEISYNIHMPIDIHLGDLDPHRRHYAIDAIKRVVDLTRALVPSTYTLHLAYNDETTALRKWQELIFESMEQLLLTGINSEAVCIENLMYPFAWIEDIITAFQLSICLDLGHLILQEADMEAMFKKHKKMTPIIHLYGVENQHEHLSLDRLSKKDLETILKILKAFSGVVSIEVFSYNHLRTSLDVLERCWLEKMQD
ncbi:MAG: sugar phosphate isomerase/epimerase [Desulfobacterales bacterium]|nr:MAG: sugar phosphate isomerase/epimerase [Desulfobacterales bacterium]